MSVHLWAHKILSPNVWRIFYRSNYWSLVALICVGPQALLVPALAVDVHGHVLLELADQPLPPAWCVAVGHEPGSKVFLACRQMAVVPTKLQDKIFESFSLGMRLHLKQFKNDKREPKADKFEYPLYCAASAEHGTHLVQGAVNQLCPTGKLSRRNKM